MAKGVFCPLGFLNEEAKRYCDQKVVLAYLVCLSFLRLGGNLLKT